MNRRLKPFTRFLFSNTVRHHFTYGPFPSTSFTTELCPKLVNKQILPDSVLKSFILTYKNFNEAIQKKDLDYLSKVSSSNLFDHLKSNFLTSFFDDKNLRFELENHQKHLITIENLKSYNVLYGLDLKNNKTKVNYGEKNLVPGTFLKKILYYNKDSLIKTKLFCPKILVVDVIFATDLKPVIYEKKGNKENILHQSIFNYTPEKYVWQFITYSKFKSYDVPFVINYKEMEKFIDLKEITEKQNLNLISFSEKRQKEYERFGWKVNNINGFMPSKYEFVDF